jgi:hypothetical protein
MNNLGNLDSETQEMKICGILCILTRPRENSKNNILLTRKIREIGKMCMEILATVQYVLQRDIKFTINTVVENSQKTAPRFFAFAYCAKTYTGTVN